MLNKLLKLYGESVNIKKLLSLNVVSLMKAKGISNAKALSELTQTETGGLDRSYTANLVKAEGEGVNISLNKLNDLADGLEVSAWQLLHPLGFNDEGTSLSVNSDIDLPTLVKAVSYANTVCKETDIEDDDFKAKAITLAYSSLLHNQEDKMSIEIMKLINQLNKTI